MQGEDEHGGGQPGSLAPHPTPPLHPTLYGRLPERKDRFGCTGRGTVWVSDRMQTRVYHWRPPTCRREPHAIEVGTIRTTGAPLSSIPLMTVDHHGQGRAGLRDGLEHDRRSRHRREALYICFSSAEGAGVPPFEQASPRDYPPILHQADCGQWVWGNFLCRPDSTPLSCCPWRPGHCPRAPNGVSAPCAACPSLRIEKFLIRLDDPVRVHRSGAR